MVSAGSSPTRSVPATGTARWLAQPGTVFYGVALLGFAIQAVTGFGGRLFLGGNAGWLLFIHMLGAPLFIIGLTGFAVIWAERCQFGGGGPYAARRLPLVQRVLFWAVLVFGLATVLTMLAAMLPTFGYAALDALREAHKYTALLLVITVGAHAIVSLAAKWARRKTG